MEFIKGDTGINFLGRKTIALFFSIALITGSIASLVAHGGPNYGIDFKGGSLVQLKFNQPTAPQAVRDALGGLDLGDFSVQEFGAPEEILINMEAGAAGGSDNVGGELEKILIERFGKTFSVERVEMVGPKVGGDLRQKAVLAIVYALAGILIYITVRFELRFGLAAIAALVHDTTITIGAFSVFDKEFTLPVIAALLTVIGYSLNDTIVVFDRIRENLKLKRGMAPEKIINLSINQTLSRTLLTSGTTLAVVLAIFFLGGEVIHDFSFALLVGILIGTYSSIFVASPLLLLGGGLAKKKKG